MTEQLGPCRLPGKVAMRDTGTDLVHVGHVDVSQRVQPDLIYNHRNGGLQLQLLPVILAVDQVQEVLSLFLGLSPTKV